MPRAPQDLFIRSRFRQHLTFHEGTRDRNPFFCTHRLSFCTHPENLLRCPISNNPPRSKPVPSDAAPARSSAGVASALAGMSPVSAGPFSKSLSRWATWNPHISGPLSYDFLFRDVLSCTRTALISPWRTAVRLPRPACDLASGEAVCFPARTRPPAGFNCKRLARSPSVAQRIANHGPRG